MRHAKLLRVVIILIAAGLLIFLIFYSRTAAYTANGVIQETRVFIYARLSFVGNFISNIKKIKTLTEENISLEEKNQNLLSQLASWERLKEDNNFLREALNIPVVSGYELSDAGVFNLKFTPDGHYLLINKGIEDNIKKEDIVISSSGTLIGIVGEVFNNYSKVLVVTDFNFKATIKVLSKEISGIANGAGADGIYLDFISQNDDVANDDIIVTGGNDIFPPGLIIGKVIQVGSDNGSLFKKVKVKPMIEEIDLSRAIVIIR